MAAKLGDDHKSRSQPNPDVRRLQRRRPFKDITRALVLAIDLNYRIPFESSRRLLFKW